MRKITWIVVGLLVVFLGAGALAFEPISPEELRVGFVYVGPVGDGGWTFMHDLSRRSIEEKFPGATTSFVEAVPVGPDAVRVMETFIRHGAQLVFATSFGYMDQVIEVAQRHPEVIFMHCSGYRMADNVGVYFGRMYQARYLSGLVAGSLTESNVIGYVAAHPIPEVVRMINAFTLGVREVNPYAVVRVVWLFSWYDPGKETEATKALIDAGSDVIAMHADSGATALAAEEAGVYVIGYNSDMSRFAPTRHLTAPIWNWSVLTTYVAEQVINGTWRPENLWWGMDTGIVDLAPFGPAVPEEVRNLVGAARERIVEGAWKVFTGPIRDQQGAIRVAEGEVMSDEDLLSFSWFVEGVEGEIPARGN
ncbi:MAG TPA: BMP family ABC transporter substrate-binding protein [Atribacteraceae bacterium]|nr:BMP family ABC transporter substrate-binding protein [Atribacteraceae bacterium]